MMMQQQGQGMLSGLEKHKLTYTATGLFVIGAILFVIGSIMLFIVSKDEYEEELRGDAVPDHNLFV